MKFDYERMKDLRESKEMTQEQLAEKIGKKRQQVASWEKGKNEPSIKTIGEIAEALGVPGNFLIKDIAA